MRIVSQNGKFDVPYEMCALICEETMIYAKSPFGEQWLFAEYSASEKAQRAMEMIHVKYEDSFAIIPQVLGGTPYMHARNTVFQMPMDSEVDDENEG